MEDELEDRLEDNLIFGESSSLYLSDMQHVALRLEDMVDFFSYSILFIALQRLIQPILSSSRESPQPFPSHHTLLGTKKEIEYWHDVNSTSSRKNPLIPKIIYKFGIVIPKVI
jgi:hypothetical protein